MTAPWAVYTGGVSLSPRPPARPAADRRAAAATVEDLRTFVTFCRTHRTDIGQRQVVVRLDGGAPVTLRFGESWTEEIQPGQHRLRIHNTLFWKNLTFATEPGEHLEFQIINSARWWTAGMVGLLGSAPLFLTVLRRNRN
jgi:hypothetical protein